MKAEGMLGVTGIGVGTQGGWHWDVFLKLLFPMVGGRLKGRQCMALG